MAESVHVGERLAILRKWLGLNQTELAAAIGVASQGTVSDWERGKTPPDLGRVRLAADLCANGRAAYQWLLRGGRQPRFDQPESGPGDEVRLAVAARLRELADELDPLSALDASAAAGEAEGGRGRHRGG